MTTNTDTKRTAHNTGHTPYTGHLERGPDRIYNGPAIRLDLAGYGGAVELGFEGCTMAEAPDDYATFIVTACNAYAANQARIKELEGALRALLGAYESDKTLAPSMDVLTSWETNGRPVAAARAALNSTGAAQ